MTVAHHRRRSRNLILTAMIFAVSMTFIDQSIIQIAMPRIHPELGLSATGVQCRDDGRLPGPGLG